MITAINFSEYELNGMYYGGSERKEGITLAVEDYMIKYQKQTAFGKRKNRENYWRKFRRLQAFPPLCPNEHGYVCQTKRRQQSDIGRPPAKSSRKKRK